MKQYKYTLIALVFGFASYTSSAALTLNWSYGGTLATPVPSVTAGWLIQMYQDVSANTVLSSITSFNSSDIPQGASANASDDQVLSSFTTSVTLSKGAFTFLANGLSADTIANASVYTVLFNNALLASATQAWIIDTTPKLMPGSGGVSYTPNATASTVAYGGPSGLSVVPEPSSFALIGVGLAAIALRRRFAK